MDLQALKVLEATATPAPWKKTGNGSMIEAPGEPFPVAKVYGYGRFNRKHTKVAADGRLIAAFRNMAPEILAVLAAAESLENVWLAQEDDDRAACAMRDALDAFRGKLATL